VLGGLPDGGDEKVASEEVACNVTKQSQADGIGWIVIDVNRGILGGSCVKIRIRDVEGGIKIVDCIGKLTLDKGSVRLGQAVLNLLDKGWTKIILNLGEVSHLDGAALGELVSCWKRARVLGAEIKLLNLSGRLNRVMDMTKLSSLFGGRYCDEPKAIASFRNPPETKFFLKSISQGNWSSGSN